MKKIFGILGLSAFSIALLTSCQKDYTCTCVVNNEQYVYTYEHERKKDVSKACDERGAAAKLEDKKAKCTLTSE